MSKVGISENLSNIYDSVDDSGKMAIHEKLQHYIGVYKDLKLKNPFDLISVAHTVQGEVQKDIDKKLKMVKKEGKYTLSCRQGCSFCCYLFITITDDEALLLTTYAESKGIEIDYDHLEKQSSDTMEEFDSRPIGVRKCTFLDENGSCKVYDVRPTSCRTLNVVSDPKLCDMENHKGKQVLRVVDAEAEIISCATSNATECDSMAKMLLQVKQ